MFLGLYQPGAPLAKIEQVHNMKISNFLLHLRGQEVQTAASIFVREGRRNTLNSLSLENQQKESEVQRQKNWTRFYGLQRKHFFFVSLKILGTSEYNSFESQQNVTQAWIIGYFFRDWYLWLSIGVTSLHRGTQHDFHFEGKRIGRGSKWDIWRGTVGKIRWIEIWL